MLLYASNRRLEGWGSLVVGGPVELVIWRSVSSLETAPMWVSPTQSHFQYSDMVPLKPMLNPIYCTIYISGKPLGPIWYMIQHHKLYFFGVFTIDMSAKSLLNISAA